MPEFPILNQIESMVISVFMDVIIRIKTGETLRNLRNDPAVNILIDAPFLVQRLRPQLCNVAVLPVSNPKAAGERILAGIGLGMAEAASQKGTAVSRAGKTG